MAKAGTYRFRSALTATSNVFWWLERGKPSGLLLPVPVLDSGSLLTHLSAVPKSGVGLLCNLIIRIGGHSFAAQQHAGCP